MKAEVINGNLNLRKTRKGEVIAVIPNGTIIEVGLSMKGWTEATYDGKEGFVKNNFIRLIKD